MESATNSLTQKIQTLTPEQLSKVERLIDSLQTDDHYQLGLLLSEPAFATVWNDHENDIYDAL